MPVGERQLYRRSLRSDQSIRRGSSVFLCPSDRQPELTDDGRIVKVVLEAEIGQPLLEVSCNTKRNIVSLEFFAMPSPFRDNTLL